MPAVLESKLPAAQQARRERLAAEQVENTAHVSDTAINSTAAVVRPTVVDPPTQPEAQPHTPEDIPPTQLSPEEVAALRAQANDAAVERGRAETLRLEVAELQAALTRAQEPPKAGDDGLAAPSPGDTVVASHTTSHQIEPGDIEFNEQEKEDYTEVEPTITKVANRQIAKLVNPQLDALTKRILQLENNVHNVSSVTARVTAESFVDKVKAAVPKFDVIVKTPAWQTFLETKIPGTRDKYVDSLTKAHRESDLETMKEIFAAFEAKTPTVVQDDTTPSFTGIPTSAAGSTEGTPKPANKEVLKMSERRKASEDFLKGRITAEKLKDVKEKFALADREGRVDYNN